MSANYAADDFSGWKNPFEQQTVSDEFADWKNPFESDDGGQGRGITGVATDSLKSVAVGTNALLELAGNIYGLTTGDMENWASGQGARGREYWNARKSPQLKQLEAERKAKVDAAEGELAKMGVSAWETLTSPALLASYTFEQIPNLFVTGGAGRVAGTATKAILERSGREVTEKVANRAALGGAVTAGGAMQGADVGGSAFDQLMALPDEVWLQNPMLQERINGNMDLLPRAKREIATELSRDSAVASAAISVGINTLPIFRILEERLAGVTGKSAQSRLLEAGKGFIGESLGEGVEEGSGAALANVAINRIDPSRPITQGVGEAAGMGLAAGPMGLIAGAIKPRQDLGAADVARTIFEAPDIDSAIDAAGRALDSFEMPGVDFEPPGAPAPTQPEFDPDMQMPTVEFDSIGLPILSEPGGDQPSGPQMPGVDFRTRRDDETDVAYAQRMAQEQAARDRDLIPALEQKADQDIQRSAIEQQYSPAAAPANPAITNALISAYVRQAPESTQEAPQERPAAQVLAAIEKLATKATRTVTMPSGNPFPNERVAKSSMSFRNNPGSRIVPAPSGDGVLIEIPQASSTNSEWREFAPETGTLNIPRAEMPQIKAEHRGAMVNFLKGQFIDSEIQTIPANTLKPSQTEFSPAKVKQALEYQGGNRSILVSADNYVIDGHHQWLANLDGDIQVIRIDAPAQEILEVIKKFPSATTGEASPQTGHSAKILQFARKAQSLQQVRDFVRREFGERGARALDAAAVASWNTRNQERRRRVNPDDSLAVAVAKLGGISLDWRQDITGDTKANKMIPGVGQVFSKSGTSPDDMAVRLLEEGYITQEQLDDMDARDVIYEAIASELSGGTKRYKLGSEKALEEQLQDLEDQYASETDQLQNCREQMYREIEEEHGAEVAQLARLYDIAADQAVDQLIEDVAIYEEQIQEIENVRQSSAEADLFPEDPATGDERVRQAAAEADRQPEAPGRAQAQATAGPGGQQVAQESPRAAASSEAVVVSDDQKIEDLGEKIGGARKDTSTSRASSGKSKSASTGWRGRYEINEIVAGSNKGKFAVRKKSSSNFDAPLGGWNAVFDTREGAERALPMLVVAQKHSVTAARDADGNQVYEIWRRINDRKRVKVVDQQFQDRDAAMRYMALNAEQIIDTNTTFGEADLPKPESLRRIWAERRQGNVNGQDFMDTFGLRAVEFGNWNNQEERQLIMNEAFDGLLDLAQVLNIPARAIGLNGDLALAFGARGQGLTSARAHYERDKAVINLTKMKGAGALAHEWFHALDHYFGRQDGKASSEWIADPDGTRSLKAGDREDDFVSHGFKRANSGVRVELRAAYDKLMRTMFTRAETFVKDTLKADEFVAKSREELAQQLDLLRKDLSEQKDPRYWKRKNKPATADQLAKFDVIAKQFLAGEMLATDSRKNEGSKSRWSFRWSNDALDQISEIYKEVRGRSGFDSTNQNGVLDSLRNYMRRYSERLKMLADAQANPEGVKGVPTEFAMNARELDQGRGEDYWTTPHEMAARAFQGYVEDKISDQGGRSPFLNYAPEKANILTPWGWKKPYPHGDERKAINREFDNFVSQLQTRETDAGVALFSAEAISRSPNLIAKADAKGSTVEQVQAAIATAVEKLKAELDVIVVQSVSDLPLRIRRQIPPEARIKGAYESGMVYLIADNIQGGRDAQVVLAHELVGHKGVLEMLASDQWGALTANIDRLLKKGSTTAKSIAEETDQRYGRASSDDWYAEFMAIAAERRQKDGPIAALMRKLRELIQRALSALGLKGPFSASQLDMMLSDAEARLATRQGNGASDRAPAFSSEGRTLSAETGEFVDGVLSGAISASEVIDVDGTPAVYQALGASDLPLRLPGSVVKKAVDGKHSLTADQLKDALSQLHDPVMVFDSATELGALVALTSVFDEQGRPVVAAIHLERKSGRYEVNSLASIHGRSSASHIKNWIEGGLLAYRHKKKSRSWLQSVTLQLRWEGVKNGSRGRILLDSDLVNDGDSRFSAEGFVLSQYTEEELAEIERKRQSDIKAEQARKSRLAADEQLDDFTLTGSDLEADKAAARGQRSLFSQEPLPVSAKTAMREIADQFRAETGVDIATVGTRMAGIEIRNNMRKNGKPAGNPPTLQLEDAPFTDDQMAMHEQWERMQNPSSKYLFHTTPASNIQSIARSGLTPGRPARFEGVSSESRVSLAANEEVASYYGGADHVMLRINKKHEFRDLEADLLAGGDGAYTTGETIPPEAIEVKQGRRWVPILSASGETIEVSSALPDTIEINGIQRPSKNSKGQPIHTTEEGVRNFWHWFGDSKVVDAQGRPLVVYHGSRPSVDFDEFETGEAGAYFTPNHQYAEAFTDDTFDEFDGARGQMLPVYLSIANPKIVRAREGSEQWDGFISYQLDKRAIQDDGADGAILIDDASGDLDQVIAINPEQIKSAIGNTGSFDPRNPGILFSQESIIDWTPQDQAQSEFSEEHRRLKEMDRTLWDNAKKLLRKKFAPGGLLPDSVFREKIDRDGKLNVVELTVQGLVAELEAAIRKEYGAQLKNLNATDMKRLSDALAGKMPANMKEQTATAIVAMRQYIDHLSADYASILQAQIDQLVAPLDEGELALLRGFVEAGKVEPAGDTPAEKSAATRKRNQILDEARERATAIWGDGKKMQSALAKAATIAERASLMETILGNQGRYVHRSYQVFDDPLWYKKISPEVFDNAMSYLIDRFLEDGTMSEDQARARAEKVIDEIVKTDTAYSDIESFIKESKLGAKDLSVLKRRKDIAPEIRALMGEYVDPRINFAKTATKMGRLIFNQRFLDAVRRNGMGVFLFDKASAPVGTEEIAAEGSEVYAPLNGLHAPREVIQAFKDALGKEQMATWYKVIVQFNGMVKGGKTVLSPTTSARNFQSAMFFALANGHFDLTQARKAMALINKFDDRQKLEYVKKLVDLGVLYDNPYAREMMDLLRESGAERFFDETSLIGRALGTTADSARSALQAAQAIYSFGDDFWKVIGFENEKAALMKYGRMSEAQAEKEAADRIRNLYPTYSMVGEAVQWLRRFPLVGTFVSFPAEIIRTSFNIFRTVRKDWITSGMRPLAMRRALGMSFVGGFAYAAQEIAKAMFDIDDDDEEAIRLQAAPWQQNSNLVVTGRDEDGNLQYIDISFLDPYNYFKRPITAMMRDQPWQDALISGARDMLSPFFGTDIAAGAILEIYSNKTATGGQVYKESDPAGRQLLDIADHLRTAIQPGIASNLERTWKAIEGQTNTSGKKFDLGDEGLAWIGWRVSTLEPKTALYYRSFEFGDAKAEANKTLTEVLNDPNEVGAQSIERAYERSVAMRQQAYADMEKIVSSARRSGLSVTQIRMVLKSSGVSQEDATALLSGNFPHWKPTQQAERLAVQRAEALIGREKALEIRSRYRMVRTLD